MAEMDEYSKQTALAVQTLNVMMMKKGIPEYLPEYELVYDGTENGGGFVYQVACGEHVMKASGNTKKEAKRNAAMMMLNLIKQQDQTILEQEQNKSKTEVWWARMPVNALQIICARDELPYPDYEELELSGPDHAPLFTIKCTVSSFVTRGQGASKKSAKQAAAKHMIMYLSEKRESVKKLIEELANSTSKKPQNPEIPSDERNGNIVVTNSNVNDSSSPGKYEDQGKIVSSKQTKSNINELSNGMNTSVINKSSDPLIKKLDWPPGYISCQRGFLKRKLQNLRTALKNQNFEKIEDFNKEFDNILRLLDVVPEQIIQRTHDNKFLMVIYLSTDPVIVHAAVDVDEDNLKILLHQRVVETLLTMTSA